MTGEEGSRCPDCKRPSWALHDSLCEHLNPADLDANGRVLMPAYYYPAPDRGNPA